MITKMAKNKTTTSPFFFPQSGECEANKYGHAKSGGGMTRRAAGETRKQTKE